MWADIRHTSGIKKAPSNRGLRLRIILLFSTLLGIKKAPSNRGLRRHVGAGGGDFAIQKSPIKSGIKTPEKDWRR